MRRILFTILLLFPIWAWCQTDTIFRNLSVTQTDEGVLISFTIRSGITCSGVRIERSTDAQNYMVLHEIEGVCGAINTDESYQVTDFHPIPNTGNYYRLDLGSLGLYSNVVGLHYINYDPSGCVVFPNPCMGICGVYFENSTGNPHDLILYDQSGKIVITELVSDNQWIFRSDHLATGNYFYRIYRNDELMCSGKLVIP